MSGKPNTALNAVFALIATTIALVLTLAFLVLFILTGQGLLRLGVCLMWLIPLIIILIKGAGKHSIGWSITGIAGVSFVLLVMSAMFLGVGSSVPWRYPFQRAYIRFHRSWYESILPNKLPKNISNYYFSYMPTFGQGAGHDAVRFTASTDVIEAYEKEYASQAIYTIPFSDFKDSYTTSVKEISPKAEQVSEQYPSNLLHINYDYKFWTDTDATVYVISAVHDFNHPSSYSVIISKDHTKIEFANQFG